MDNSLDNIINIVSDLGYNGIEIWGPHLEGSDLKLIADRLVSLGLSVSMISPYFDFMGNEEIWQKTLDTAKTSIRQAKSLGSPLIRAFTGVISSDEASQQQFNLCVERLKHVCKLAAVQGVSFALETHPNTLVDNVPATKRLTKAVDMPNLKINLDIYHMWEVHSDPVKVLDSLFDEVVHIHAKNANIPPHTRYPLLHDQQASQEIVGVTPLQEGNMNYDQFLSALKKKAFSGYVSLEWFGPDVVSTAASELKYLRSALS